MIDQTSTLAIRDKVESMTPAEAKQAIQNLRKGFAKSKSNVRANNAWLLLSTAMVFRGQRQYDDAFELLDKTKTLFIGSADEFGLALVHHELSFINREIDRNALALEYAFKAIPVFEKGSRKAELAWAYDNLSVIHLNLFNRPESLAYAKRARTIFTELDSKHGLAWNACNLGLLYTMMGFYDHAERYYVEAARLFEQLKSFSGIAWSMVGLGTVFRSMGEFDEADRHFQKAEVIYDKLQLKDRVAWCLLNQAGMHRLTGKISEAETLNKKAIQLFSPLRNNDGVGWGFMQSGQALRDQSQYMKSWQILREALNLHTDIGNRKGTGWDQNEMGETYVCLDDLSHARECFIKARVIADQLDEIGLKFEVDKNLANLFIEEGNIQRAQELVDKCQAVMEKHRSLDSEIELLILRSKLEIVTGRVDNALSLLESAEKLSEKSGLLHYQPRLQVGFGEVLAAKNQEKEALKRFSKCGETALKLKQPAYASLAFLGSAQLSLPKGSPSTLASLSTQIEKNLKGHNTRKIKARLQGLKIMLGLKEGEAPDVRSIEQCLQLAQATGSVPFEYEIRQFATDAMETAGHTREHAEQKKAMDSFLERSPVDMRMIPFRKKWFAAMPLSLVI